MLVHPLPLLAAVAARVPHPPAKVGHPLLRSIIAATIATLLFVGAAVALSRTEHHLARRLKAQAWTKEIGIRGFTILRASQIRALLLRFISLAAWALGLLAAYGWVTFVLTRFTPTYEIGALLGQTLFAQAKKIALTIAGALPGLAAVVVILWITRFLQKLASSFFTAVELGSVKISWLHPDLAHPTRRIVMALLWLAALIAAYPYLPGSQSAAFKGVTVLVGVMLSLGSSGVIGQAMSGLVVMYSRALKTGDWVRIGDIEGTVTALNMMSTKIRTIRDEEVTIPSNIVVKEPTVNYSRLAGEHGVVLPVTVTIGYDAPWRVVHELLVSAAKQTAGIRENPAPYVLQRALSDYYVEYQLFAFVDEATRRPWILSDLHENVQDAFNEAGVQIMSPHFRANPPQPIVVPKEKWFGDIAATKKKAS